jgi:hypothetical protein
MYTAVCVLNLLCLLQVSANAQILKTPVTVYAFEQQVHSGVNPSTFEEHIKGGGKQKKELIGSSLQYKIYTECKGKTLVTISHIWIRKKAYAVKKELVNTPVITINQVAEEGKSPNDTLVKRTPNKVYYLNLKTTANSFSTKGVEKMIHLNDIVLAYRLNTNTTHFAVVKKIKKLADVSMF